MTVINTKKAYIKTACFWVGEGYLGHAFSLSEFSKSPKCYLPSSSLVSVWISHTNFCAACLYSENNLCLENILTRFKNMFIAFKLKLYMQRKLFSLKDAMWSALGLTNKLALSVVFKNLS